MRFIARFARPADLVTTYDQQITRGGLFLRLEPPPNLDLYQDVDLTIEAGDTSVAVRAQVVQVAPGMGVAVALRATPDLLQAVQRARAAGDAPGEPPVFELEVEGAAAPAQATSNAPAPVNAGTAMAEKIQVALHGNREERMQILKDINKTLHPYLLRNGGIQVDEVLTMAKMTGVNADLLVGIANRREWVSRPEIASALVRNPSTPIGIAIKVLDHVSATELRLLAKDPRARTPVAQAARKKVLG
jgi:hypothetical protein